MKEKEANELIELLLDKTHPYWKEVETKNWRYINVDAVISYILEMVEED